MKKTNHKFSVSRDSDGNSIVTESDNSKYFFDTDGYKFKIRTDKNNKDYFLDSNATRVYFESGTKTFTDVDMSKRGIYTKNPYSRELKIQGVNESRIVSKDNMVVVNVTEMSKIEKFAVQLVGLKYGDSVRIKNKDLVIINSFDRYANAASLSKWINEHEFQNLYIFAKVLVNNSKHSPFYIIIIWLFYF
ncbi:MAG: hypothetical protein U9N59_15840 [Campylobacterota bacterium]|nr:hypothetical protein [Campylobacterota bacterium]